MENERQQQIERDRKIQWRILELFDEQRRTNSGHPFVQIDVEKLCTELDIAGLSLHSLL